MATNNIKDIKTVDSENFDYLLAETNFRIESVFRSRNKAVIEPNVPVISSKTDIAYNTQKTIIQGDTSKTKPGATFSFIIDANDYQLYDLRDAEFDIQAQYVYISDVISPGNNPGISPIPPSFGNQCLLSLFQNIELFIDGTSIARNAYPGFSSNAEYALRYPHCKTLEKDFEVHGFNTTYRRENIGTVGHTIKAALDNVLNKFDNQSITINGIPDVQDLAQIETSTYVIFTGFITQRVRLSDIFSVVETLPPLYNHKVEIKFQRQPHNILICNTNVFNSPNGTIPYAHFLGFMKFKLFQDVYNTTDQFIATAKKYYSTPKETLITQDKQLLVPIITIPDKSTQQSFNINIDTAYKNKLLTIVIPRTTDFARQLSVASQYNDARNNAYVADYDNGTLNKQYDVYASPSNSYTYGGLKYLDVQTANGLLLYHFDMDNDGVISCPNGMVHLNKPITQLNETPGTNNIYVSNYQDVYRQYVKARLHFQQTEEEAIDFETFCKEYCIYCVDLSCFNLSPNENIRLNFGFGPWEGNYNPYYAFNAKVDANSIYMSSSIICNLFCDKVLRLLPNRQIQLADLMTTSSVEVDNTNQA